MTGPAVVLGSSQSDLVEEVAGRAPDVEVVVRRSGGGAVWLEPEGQLWVDLTIDRTHPGWSDDVGKAFGWVGELWLEALVDYGLDSSSLSVVPLRGGSRGDRLSRLLCFAGLGAGEVLLGGRKLVGMAQRRTRDLARFMTVVNLRHDPEPLVSALVPDPAAVDLARLRLSEVAELPARPGGTGRLWSSLIEGFTRP